MAAFTIIGDEYNTGSTLKQLFEFLGDFANFKSILPEDKVTDFQYSGDQCSFSIKGITPMTVKLISKEPYQSIVFSSEGLAQFNFRLHAVFIGDAGLPGICRIELSGDLNPFIKTMAEKPLTALVNTMSQKLSQLQLNRS